MGYLVHAPPSTVSRAHTGPGLCLWVSRDQESTQSWAEKVDEKAAVLHVGTTSALPGTVCPAFSQAAI